MIINVRTAIESDIESCGRILFTSFKQISEQHNFPRPFSVLETAINRVRGFLTQDGSLFLVADADSKPAGMCFIDRRGQVAGIGPVSVQPDYQGNGIGRKLLEAALNICQNHVSVRLTQDSYNLGSGALYSSLGFEVREPILVVEGRFNKTQVPGVEIRQMKKRDVIECRDLYARVHGVDRSEELLEALKLWTCFVSIGEGGRITGYISALARWGHGVAETEDELIALMAGVQARNKHSLHSFNLPLRQEKLARWCFDQGFRAVKPLTLLTHGFYQEPDGSFYISGRY